MALKAEFTGSTHIIKIKSGQNIIDVQKDLYSAAKDEWLNEVDNLHNYRFPFIVIGGNDIGAGQKAPTYYFLQSPWIIETNGDGTLHSFGLNLYGQDNNGNPRDPFNVLAGDSLNNETSSIPGSDLLEIINNNTTDILNLIQNNNSGQTDWNTTEKDQIRDALGIDGNKIEAIDGQLQDLKTCCDESTTDENTDVIIESGQNSNNNNGSSSLTTADNE